MTSNVEAEQALVGSMLIDPSCTPAVLRLVTSHDFAEEPAAVVFRTIERRHRQSAVIDPVALLPELRENWPICDIEPTVYLAIIGDRTPTAAHAEHYANIVAEAALKRRIADELEAGLSGAQNGKPAREILNELHCFADQALQRLGPTGEAIKGFSLAILRDSYQELAPPVIDGLIREGETCNVIAAPKVGKSWFVYNVAIATIMGWSLFDRYSTSPGKVLLIDNELHRSTLAHRIPKVADAMGIPVDEREWMKDFEIWPLRGDLRSLPEVGRELEKIEPGTYKLIILDAKYRFILEGSSENDNAAESQFYNRIDRYAQHTKAAFMLVHHSSKGNQSDKSVTDVGAGAGAQSRATDCHLVLREHEDSGHIVLDAAVRSFKPVEPLVLRWEFPLWVAAEGKNPTELKGMKSKGEEATSRRDAEGLNLIAKALSGGKRMTRSMLRTATGMGPDRVNKLVAKLRNDGRLEQGTIEVRGNETDEFWLST